MSSLKYKDANGVWRKVGLGRNVSSVNGKYGDVAITAAELGAAPNELTDETAAALGLNNGASVDNALAKLSNSIAVKRTAITLNDLEIGSVLKFNETVSGVTTAVEFELVIKDYNGTGRALVMRKTAWDNTGNFGSYNCLYAGSTIDNFMTTYLSYLDAEVQAQIESVDIPVITNLSSASVGAISRRVFALSNAELGLVERNTEGSAIPYFTNATRTKTNSAGTAVEWWTRTVSSADSGRAYLVTTGGGYTNTNTTNARSYVPAFTLPSDFATEYIYDMQTPIGESVTEIVAQALGGVKIETGSYTGTGTYGSSNKNTIALPSAPKFGIIYCTNERVAWEDYSIPLVGVYIDGGEALFVIGRESLDAVNDNTTGGAGDVAYYFARAEYSNGAFSWYSAKSAITQMNYATSYQYAFLL